MAGGVFEGAGAAAVGALGGIGAAIGNARQAAKNRAFQERMFRHRYEYTMEDLRRSGLNPLLAAQGLGGGGVPSGATATFQNPAATAASDYVKGKKVSPEAKLIGSQTDAQQAAAELSRAQARREDKAASFIDQQIIGQGVTNALESMKVPVAADTLAYWRSDPGQAQLRRKLSQEGMSYPAKIVNEVFTGVGYLGDSISDRIIDTFESGLQQAHERNQRRRKD